MGQEVDVQNKHIDRIAGKVRFIHLHLHLHSRIPVLISNADRSSRRPDRNESCKTRPHTLRLSQKQNVATRSRFVVWDWTWDRETTSVNGYYDLKHRVLLNSMLSGVDSSCIIQKQHNHRLHSRRSSYYVPKPSSPHLLSRLLPI